MQNHIARRFYTVSFTTLLITCILLPIAFLPSSIGTFAAVKYVLLYTGTMLALATWIISQFIEGTMHFPRHKVLLGLFVAAALSLLSSFFSPNVHISLWGKIFSFDSFATVTVLTLLTFLVSLFAREQKRLVQLFVSTFFVSVGVVLLQIFLFILKGVPFIANNFGHVASQGTMVGTWVDFSLFSAFAFILSLLMIEVLNPRGIFRTFGLVGVSVSLLALIFLNFNTAWLLAVVSALLVFVYKTSVERALVTRDSAIEEQGQYRQTFPVVSFISLLIGLFLLLAGPSIGAAASRLVGLTFSDVRPSLGATLEVAQPVLSKDPFFGAGPARFAEQWELYKPLGINTTVFWNSTFEGGYSTIATLTITNGILLALVFLGSFGIILVHGFRLFNYRYPDRFTRFIAVSSLIMLIPFIALLIISRPSIVLIVYGFLLIGLLIGVSVLVGKTKLVTFHYLKDPRSSFFIILLLVVISLAALSGAFLSISRFMSSVAYNRALTVSESDVAIRRTLRALSFSRNDAYLRTLSSLYVSKFSTAANAGEKNQAALQQYFTNAESAAQQAINYDPTSAANWGTLGSVYQLLVPANTENAYENAQSALARAATLAPVQPLYQLALARLEIVKKNNTTAQAAIDRAIELKPNLLDAYLLRAQTRQAVGNTAGVREVLKNYTRSFPYADSGFYVLGSFELGLKEYQAAKEAFNTARSLNPYNLDAQLGYINALKGLGQKTEAIAALEALQRLAPSLTGISAEIERLQTGQTSSSTSTEAGSAETEE